MRKLLFGMLGAVAALALTVGKADAVILNAVDVGASGTTNINGVVENFGGPVPGLTSSLFLEYTGLSNGGLTWNFDYTLTNTTNNLNAEVSSFGLTTTPNVTGATSTGLFNTAVIQVQAGFLGVVDFCATAGATCGGGGSNGLDPGAFASGEFSLTFGSVLPFISLDGAFARYQAIDGTVLGYTFNGDSGFGINTPNINPLAVPGPIVGAGLPGLVAACLGLMGLARRRKKRLAVA